MSYAITPTFGWLLCPPIKRRPSKAMGPPVSLFFCQLIWWPKQQYCVLLHVAPQPCLFSNAPPHINTKYRLIAVYFVCSAKRRPPKSKALSLSLFLRRSIWQQKTMQSLVGLEVSCEMEGRRGMWCVPNFISPSLHFQFLHQLGTKGNSFLYLTENIRSDKFSCRILTH